ncbi:transposase [Pseudaminobacter soli (ex Li et al. 2025)]|uniref:transposase n=1 Tax=Pseudaminobacter soli (ex Li et al. 2025) TaxID=1295366 RepID=UPI002472F0E8|nr:transposase [Mesorhizobium soli]
MARRRIGQGSFGFGDCRARCHSSLDDLCGLIDWSPVEHHLAVISCAAKGEPAWPLLALLKAMLLSVWHDLSDVKLAEALDDRASFRRFCGDFQPRSRRPNARLCPFSQGPRGA